MDECLLHPADKLCLELLVDNVVPLNEHHKLTPHILECNISQVVNGEDLGAVVHNGVL